ncbi:hypothetical protein D6C85_04727 [Aureobasidium pullulans]|uniref:Piwi domain-containing protein n=1 Tax=Aureobasidium pullulans TaxID=5580 RepID=A0A4V4KY78_AURPU|nr:hypothetical protein D6C85_04727 [Aureobasidium pullulans]
MKKAFAKINVMPRFLVIIASKRHHVRFFPQSGVDKNANRLPGTLVETGVTQPFENDFYLCAHTAIKDTARPVHYKIEKIRDTGYGERFKHRATRSSTSTQPVHPCYHSCLTLPCRVLRPHPLPAAYPVIARTTRDYVAMTQLVLSTTTSFSTSLSGITAYKSTRHTLIYEHSYQYIPEFHRGARQRHRPPSVSLFPAVYYAHIASLRGAHHSKSFGNPAAYDNTVSNTTDPVYEPLHHHHVFRSAYLL